MTIKLDDITTKPDYILKYFAPMENSSAEREELARRFGDGPVPQMYIETDGRKFEFTGEYEEVLVPSSRRVAPRNKRSVWYPVYVCSLTDERVLRADFMQRKKPEVVNT